MVRLDKKVHICSGLKKLLVRKREREIQIEREIQRKKTEREKEKLLLTPLLINRKFLSENTERQRDRERERQRERERERERQSSKFLPSDHILLMQIHFQPVLISDT